MTDIFREIDEELRRDRLEKLWARYGHYVIALALLIVAATGAVVGWREYQARERRAESVKYAAALDEARRGQDAAAGQALNALARSTSSGYAALALLQEAAIKARAKDEAGALAAYDALAADNSVDPLYRDLATVLAAERRLETDDPKTVIDRVAPIANGNSAWRAAALEVTALAQLRAGDKAASIETFKRLADDLAAPQALRARATEMIGALKS